MPRFFQLLHEVIAVNDSSTSKLSIVGHTLCHVSQFGPVDGSAQTCGLTPEGRKPYLANRRHFRPGTASVRDD